MPALLALVVLAWCSTVAVASRTHFGLARRANASVNASAGKLDSALARKGDDSEATPCVCFLEEVETEHSYWGQHKLKFTDLDSEGNFRSLRECSERCPRECHNEFKYKFDPWEAHAVGAEHVSVPMTASKCSEEGKCKCLDADTTTARVEEYKRREQRHLDIAETKKIYNNPEQCLERCECRDQRRRGYWSSQEFDYEGLCVDEWRWGWFLYGRQEFCPYLSQGVGLVSCGYTQQFKLKEDRSRGGHAYKVQLDELEDGRGREVQKNIKLKVVKFEAETSTLYRTAAAEVGVKGMKTRWKVYKTSVMGQRWSWTVEDEDGEVRFTINQQRWAGFKGSVWKVYSGTKSEGRHAYYAYGDHDANANEEGFKYRFYRDKEKSAYAGMLKHKGYDKNDDEDKYKVQVLWGEDAGLIPMTSVLIDKAHDAQRR